jgi:hypothetical protein
MGGFVWNPPRLWVPTGLEDAGRSGSETVRQAVQSKIFRLCAGPQWLRLDNYLLTGR